MAGAIGTNVVKDGNGTAIVGGVRMFDVSGTGAGPWVPVSLLYDPVSGALGTIKAASTQATATDTSLVVQINPNSPGVISTGTAGTPASTVLSVQGIAGGTSVPVAVAPSTTDVAVTPTVTALAYSANNVIGGIMTFASILAATSFNGILQSITAKFKGTAVTGNLNIFIFKASPALGTYTDHGAATWNAGDMASLLGTYVLTSPLSLLGTMTTYNLDGIGKALVGSSTSLFVVATVSGTPTPASASDFTLELSVLPG